MPSEQAPTRIVAVTVCIEFSSILKRTITNKAHFERWIIVTVQDDIKTIDLCREADVDCVVLDTKYRGFHAASNKAIFLEAGIERAPEDADWILLVDADVLLPYNWKQIFRESEMRRDTLYGCVARRLIKNSSNFNGSPFSVGTAHCDVPVMIPGFFQLFHHSQWSGSYANSVGGFVRGDSLSYDDVQFWQRFEGRRRKLPFTVYHFGDIMSSWTGLKVERKTADNLSDDALEGSLVQATPPSLRGTLIVSSEESGCPHLFQEGNDVVGVYGLQFHFSGKPFWWDEVDFPARIRSRIEHSLGILKDTGKLAEIHTVFFEAEVTGQWLHGLISALPSAARVCGRAWKPHAGDQFTQCIVAFFGIPEINRDREWEISVTRAVSQDAGKKVYLVIADNGEIDSLRGLVHQWLSLQTHQVILVNGCDGKINLEGLAWRSGVSLLEAKERIVFPNYLGSPGSWLEWALRASTVLDLTPGDIVVEACRRSVERFGSYFASEEGPVFAGRFGVWVWDKEDWVFRRFDPSDLGLQSLVERSRSMGNPKLYRVMPDTALWLYANSQQDLRWILGIIARCELDGAKLFVGMGVGVEPSDLRGELRASAEFFEQVSEEEFARKMMLSDAGDYKMLVSEQVSFPVGTAFGLYEMPEDCDVMIAKWVWKCEINELGRFSTSKFPNILSGCSLVRNSPRFLAAVGSSELNEIEYDLAAMFERGEIVIREGFEDLFY